MCGIAGIIQFDGPPIPESWLDLLVGQLEHRGPDGQGRFREQLALPDGRTVRIALVHTRLAIIDPATGQQPMLSTADPVDPNLVGVICNGCIYNHQRLRQELEGLGHIFQSDHCDTEVIVRGYEEWGRSGDAAESGGELLRHLDGMFAFAVYDRRQRSLMLARDRAGEKPLYYSFQQTDTISTFIFASTLPAVRALINLLADSAAAPRTPHWHLEYLATGSCGPTALPGPAFQLLEPGHVLILDLRNLAFPSPVPYWRPERPRPPATPSAPAPDFDSLLRTAVHERLEADVPLGCFLSGGIDSALLAKYALEKKPALKTYCVRMPDPRYDESQSARQVARHLKADHTTLEIDSAAAADDLVHLINQLGQPFADSSILPTYWVAKAARQQVKVALSGDGADELFLGYERFQAARYLQRYRNWLRFIPSWPCGQFHPKSKFHKLARLGIAARGLGYADLTTFFTSAVLRRLDPAYLPPAKLTADSIEAAQSHEFTTYLPDDLLRKVDTAALAVALEVRAPFLATEVIEQALATPVAQLMPGGERKGLLKNIARRYLPAEIVDRPKMGFAIPLGEWFRTDYGNLRTLLEDQLNSVEPFGNLPINCEYPRKLLHQHLAAKRDHTHRLFALLTLALWAHTPPTPHPHPPQ